jgi:hypothetical protein
MGKLLDNLLGSGLAFRKGPWYYLKDGNVQLGNSKDSAEAKIIEIDYVPPTIETKDPVTAKPSLQKNLEALKETSAENVDFYESLVGDLQDIRSFGQDGGFNVYVFGVDSRLENHPTVKKCPFVFSWRLVSKNVSSGSVITNSGWTVLSKSKLKVDPRTGKRWVSTNRDDSPGEDFIRVGMLVLCYANKKEYLNMLFEQVEKNMTRTAEMADARVEHAKNMAVISKDDPVKSMRGFQDQNRSEQARAIEFVAQGSEELQREAKSIMAGLDKAEDVDDVDSMNARLAQLQEKAMSGSSSSVVSSKRVTFDNI